MKLWYWNRICLCKNKHFKWKFKNNSKVTKKWWNLKRESKSLSRKSKSWIKSSSRNNKVCSNFQVKSTNYNLNYNWLKVTNLRKWKNWLLIGIRSMKVWLKNMNKESNWFRKRKIISKADWRRKKKSIGKLLRRIGIISLMRLGLRRSWRRKLGGLRKNVWQWSRPKMQKFRSLLKRIRLSLRL